MPSELITWKIPRSRSPASQPSSSLPQRYQAGHDDDFDGEDGGDDENDDNEENDDDGYRTMAIR